MSATSFLSGAIAVVVAAQVAFASASTNKVESLQDAINDLRVTYGTRYPRAVEFLKRLDAIKGGLNSTNSRESATALEVLRQEALVANPLVCGQPILFVKRLQYRPGHHNTETFFPRAEHECNSGAFTGGGALKSIDFGRNGEVKTLIELPQGVARDPEVHFNGRKLVFSMRRDPADSYHIYEMDIDGSHLRQLTRAVDVDDLDPLYLSDDAIAFSSTREPKYCGCNRHIMANLFRMDADGANIHQIGKSTLFEGHGSLMPDGRILYDRWEYVDRDFGDAQGLWTVNPDGSNHAVYWGNNTSSPGAKIQSRIIPGTDRAICTFSSCHDRPWGAIAIIDRALGLDGGAPVVKIWPESARSIIGHGGFDAFKKVQIKYQDPFPLSDKYFLCSRMTGQGDEMGIYLLDVFGNEILLHKEPNAVATNKTAGAFGCYDPMPLSPRLRPQPVPARRNFAHKEGHFYVQDVYAGTHMRGVRRGDVKWLRVIEVPEKRFWTRSGWDGQGQEAPAMNWHNFECKRILGTVPVEEDGSAFVSVPSDTFVYFQLLDSNRMMIQSMRSGTIVQPGETSSCIGCHEDRRQAPFAADGLPLALRRKPSQLDGWHGSTNIFGYRKEVQPVLDRHCVRCHDFDKPAGKTLNLAGDRDLVFNFSYHELWRKKYITAVGAGPAEIQHAYSWGSHASKLMSVLQAGHHDVRLSDDEKDTLITWLDLNAPYYPSFACAYPQNLVGRSPLDDKELERLANLTTVPFKKLANHRNTSGPQISFDRPELSPCLSQLAARDSAKYQEALAIIRTGSQRLAAKPEADDEKFTACDMDQWRNQKYEARRLRELANREAIRDGKKLYDEAR